MTGFRSTDELLAAVRGLIAGLERGGHPQAATDLAEGLACLNGLTDGWAHFLEAVRRVQAAGSGRLTPEHRKALETLRAAAHAAVRRR